MTDRRLTPANGRVALAALRGRIAAETYVAGTPARITAPLADLALTRGGPRARQLLLGDPVLVLDTDRGFAFLQAGKDGYCGWVPAEALGPDTAPTHWIAAPASHLYPEPRVQAPPIAALPHGARVAVTAMGDVWAETPAGFLPAAHLRAWGDRLEGPVAAATLFLGTPYLWGGNSRAGLDCSGLVQAAFHAAGRAMPADSDLQAGIGRPLDAAEAAAPGDLIFWTGHVALVCAPDTILHATAHGMTTRTEPLAAAIARIAAAGGGPVTARRRPEGLPALPGP
ncbi:MAG: C40 family peptidase [Gemmobacter sp.]